MLKRTELVAYLEYAILLIAYSRERQWIIGNERTLQRSLPVCLTQEELEDEEGTKDEEKSLCGYTSSMLVPLQSGVRATAD